jgi:hypothetical protein
MAGDLIIFVMLKFTLGTLGARFGARSSDSLVVFCGLMFAPFQSCSAFFGHAIQPALPDLNSHVSRALHTAELRTKCTASSN